MKRNKKPLVLGTQTVKVLSQKQLENVNGGDGVPKSIDGLVQVLVKSN